jgi:type I restriction enzyme S subunit
MSFPRYEAYKDSGVEWLGEVPANWEVWKLTHAFSVIGSGTTPRTDNAAYYEDGQIHWLNTGDLNDGELFDCEKRITALAIAENSALKMYDAGSVVIAMYGATIGKLSILRFSTTVNQACCVFAHGTSVSTDFLFYWLLGLRNQIISLATGGGQPNVSQDIQRGLRVACPSIQEQGNIAAFLDRETAKIDALVEEQQQLIALLKEKRQAVISHAVTKGLNPNAPMKGSGVDWLGEIPAHWELKQIGYLCDYISYGFTNPMPTADEGPFMLTANDIDFGAIKYDTARRTTEDAFNTLLTDKSRPQKGDLLLTKDGTLGRVAVHDGQRACINQSVALVRPDTSVVISEFLCSALMGGVYQDRMIYEAGGTTIRHIYISRLAKMPLALPPLFEQSKIHEALSERLQRQDALISEAESAIALLQERRSALISAAVTGKIDVRGLAPSQAEAA